MCFQGVAHIVWCADASSSVQAVGIVLLKFMQLFATWFCNMHSFLWVWLSQTKWLLTSYCSVSETFCSNYSHSEFRSSLADLFWLANCNSVAALCGWCWLSAWFVWDGSSVFISLTNLYLDS